MSTLTFGAPTEKERDELSYYLKTDCGEALRTAIHCVKNSHNQVKGIDCHQLISEYLECCGSTPSACAERFAQTDPDPFSAPGDQE